MLHTNGIWKYTEIAFVLMKSKNVFYRPAEVYTSVMTSSCKWHLEIYTEIAFVLMTSNNYFYRPDLFGMPGHLTDLISSADLCSE